MMSFAIIIPVYNTKDYLDRCISSALDQSYDNYKIILVDDGSTDGSSLILDDYHERYPDKIVVVHKENGGLSSARNAGLEICDAKYISFLDSDDWIANDFLSSMAESINKSQGNKFVVICDREFVYSDRRVKDDIADFSEVSIIDSPELISSINLSACNKVFHRDLFLENLFPVGRIYEDIEPVLKACISADKVAKVSRVLYFVRKDNPNSITSNININENHLPENLESVRIYVLNRAPSIYPFFMQFYTRTLIFFITKVVQVGRYEFIDNFYISNMRYSDLVGFLPKLVLFLVRLKMYGFLNKLLNIRKKFI